MLRPDPATICCNAATCCSKAARPVAVSRGRGPRALAHEDAADLDIAGLLQGGELFGEGRVGQAHAVPDELEVGPLRLGCSASTAVSLTPFGSSPPVCLAPHPSAWRWLACRWAVVPPLAGTTAHRPASGSRHRRAAAEQGANRDTPRGASHVRLNPVYPHRSETGIMHPGHVLPGLAADTRPTRRLASDHGRDVRQDERSRQ